MFNFRLVIDNSLVLPYCFGITGTYCTRTATFLDPSHLLPSLWVVHEPRLIKSRNVPVIGYVSVKIS